MDALAAIMRYMTGLGICKHPRAEPKYNWIKSEDCLSTVECEFRSSQLYEMKLTAS